MPFLLNPDGRVQPSIFFFKQQLYIPSCHMYLYTHTHKFRPLCRKIKDKHYPTILYCPGTFTHIISFSFHVFSHCALLTSCVVYNSRGGDCSEAEKLRSSQGRDRKSTFSLPLQSLAPSTTTSDVPADAWPSGRRLAHPPLSLRRQGAEGPLKPPAANITLV